MSKRKALELRAADLGAEWETYLLEHPEKLDAIPDGAEIVLVPSYDPELAEYNRASANRHREPDRPLIQVHVGALAPPRSRLRRVRLQPSA